MKIISRWKASSIHLLISAAIAAVVLALMLLVWYPYPLFAAVGGQQVLMILLGVDMTLGPLITLAIFDLKKKSLRALKFDLVVIAMLQLSALLYGMNVVFQARPAFVVFSRDSFDMVTANMLGEADLAKASIAAYRSLPLTGPNFVYSEMPVDIQERNEVIMSAFSGKDLPQFPQYYLPYSEHMAAAGLAAKPVADLRAFNPDRTDEIDEAVRDTGYPENEVGYVPLRAKYQHLSVLVRKQDGQILTLLRVSPWKKRTEKKDESAKKPDSAD